jgi:DNA-binding protein
MSLVNDVLRQLDANSTKPYQTMPLHSLMIEPPAQRKKIVGISFIILVVFLFFIITLQIFYKKSLADIFYFNDIKYIEVFNNSLLPLQLKRPASVPKNEMAEKNTNSDDNSITTPERLLITEAVSESDHASKRNIEIEMTSGRLAVNKPVKSRPVENEVLKVRTVKVQAAQNTLEINNDRMLIIDDVSRIDAVKKDRFIQDVEVKDIKIKNANISNLETKIVTEKNNYQKANITAVKNIGFQHYQLSLRAYKNKRTSVALSRIDLALAAEKKDEYLRLKVRILMQKGNRAELYRFVLTQNDNESLSWFQLIAPSLQLYAYYDLSNKYYSKLIKAQPNDVKWWLAMALNYSKLEQNEKTYSIYKNLLNSSLLTDKQQRWIAKRLGRIEQGKVAINER